MPVVSCKEIADRNYSLSSERGTLDRRYTRTWLVITDDNFTGGLEALVNGSGIPQLGDSYDTRGDGGTEWDLGAQVIGYEQSHPDTSQPRVWFIRVNYASVISDPAVVAAGGPGIIQGGSPEGGGGFNENPLAQPIVWQYGPLQNRVTIYRALGRFSPFAPFDFIPGETPFINQAKQGYNPLPEIDQHGLTLTVTRNLASIDQAEIMGAFFDRLNDTAWKGWPPRWVKCDYIIGQDQIVNKLKFVQVSYHFSIKQTWDFEPLNQGSYYLDANDNHKVPQDDAGRNVFPVLLNVNGGFLADDAEPIILRFRNYREQDFSLLGL